MRYLLALIFFLAACVSNPRSSDLGKNADTALSSTVSFAKGSSTLSVAAQAELEKLLAQTRKSESSLEQISTVTIVAWADREYQPNMIRPEDLKLAQQRNQAVTEFYQARLPRAKFRSFNMAEHPNDFEKLLATNDAQMKRTLAHSSANASTAIVLLTAN